MVLLRTYDKKPNERSRPLVLCDQEQPGDIHPHKEITINYTQGSRTLASYP